MGIGLVRTIFVSYAVFFSSPLHAMRCVCVGWCCRHHMVGSAVFFVRKNVEEKTTRKEICFCSFGFNMYNKRLPSKYCNTFGGTEKAAKPEQRRNRAREKETGRKKCTNCENEGCADNQKCEERKKCHFSWKDKSLVELGMYECWVCLLLSYAGMERTTAKKKEKRQAGIALRTNIIFWMSFILWNEAKLFSI